MIDELIDGKLSAPIESLFLSCNLDLVITIAEEAWIFVKIDNLLLEKRVW